MNSNEWDANVRKKRTAVLRTGPFFIFDGESILLLTVATPSGCEIT